MNIIMRPNAKLLLLLTWLGLAMAMPATAQPTASYDQKMEAIRTKAIAGGDQARLDAALNKIKQADGIMGNVNRNYTRLDELADIEENGERGRDRRRAKRERARLGETNKQEHARAAVMHKEGFDAVYEIFNKSLDGMESDDPVKQNQATSLRTQARNNFASAQNLQSRLTTRDEYEKVRDNLWQAYDLRSQGVEYLVDAFWQFLAPPPPQPEPVEPDPVEPEPVAPEYTGNDLEESGLCYRVQIWAGRTKNGNVQALYKGGRSVMEKKIGGLYKYYVGRFNTYAQADSFRRGDLKAVADAFIVAFRNGNPIDIAEAKRETNEFNN